MIKTGNVLEDIKTYDEYEFNLIFCDPPYQLSTEWTIKDGAYTTKKANDFMNKWEGLNETMLDTFFTESFRILKMGGYLIMFGMDRQLGPLYYYATKAGFIPQQSLYWYYMCNDETTEILTKRGFKKYYEINKDDMVLTYDLNNNSVWQNINDIFIYDVNNINMLNLKNRDIDQMITYNHRLLRKTRTNPRYDYGDWVYTEAQELIEGKTTHSIFPLSYPENNIDMKEDLYYELLGIIFTDGHYQKGDFGIRITQSKQKVINRIEFILKEIGMKYSKYEYTKNCKVNGYEYKDYKYNIFYFNDEWTKKIKEIYPDKKPNYDLLNLTYGQRKSLFDGFMLGDGSTRNKQDYSIKQGNEYNIDFLQSLCQSLGYTTTKKGLILNISNKETTEIQSSSKIKKIKYTGKIWSINVDNSNYCIRRNGKVSFTGNSNFPKASDASKNIDKRLGNERKKVDENKNHRINQSDDKPSLKMGFQKNGREECPITQSTSDLGKKYEGYKYSIAPLKQTCETILVFKKPGKFKSEIDNIIGAETDKTIHPSVIDVDGNRVGFDIIKPQKIGIRKEDQQYNYGNGKGLPTGFSNGSEGRYPAQTFVDSEAAKVLDEQSGNRKGDSPNRGPRKGENHIFNDTNIGYNESNIKYEDGGCSKILNHCDYEEGEYDIMNYCPKVSTKERNAGCEKSNHPTMKPISLITKIAKLFKAPVYMKVYVPFAGVASEYIGLKNAGMEEVIGCEMNPEYVKIAEARIKHWCKEPEERVVLDKIPEEEQKKDNGGVYRLRKSWGGKITEEEQRKVNREDDLDDFWK